MSEKCTNVNCVKEDGIGRILIPGDVPGAHWINCPVCEGSGEVKKCPACKGNVHFENNDSNYCTYCEGSGVVPKEQG